MADPEPAPVRQEGVIARTINRMDTRTFIVAFMMASSFVIVILCWWKPPAADNQLLNTLMGVYVATGFVTALNWWMGSSKGSDDKNEALIKRE
jgi:hypothetical protein